MARRIGFAHTLVLIIFMIILAACGEGNGNVQGSYKPAFIPFKITYSPEGGVAVSGDQSIVTPLGEFSIGAKYSLPQRHADAVRVVIRDQTAGFDKVDDLGGHGGDFEATLNGTTKIQVHDRTIRIDVTQAQVESIEFKPAEATIQETSPNLLTKGFDRWQAYWHGAFYSPLALSRWAYDDSTMGKWYGVGFIWFILRLILALILGILDIILLLVCTFAACFYVFFGATGRNIAYGLCSIFAALLFLGFIAIRDV